MELPMFLLSIFWLYLLIKELISGISKTQEYIMYAIWILFIAEYLIKLIVAPRKWAYIKSNWITLIALVIPALRIFRIFSAFRILRTLRVVNSTNIVRALTSGKRFFSALKEAQGPAPEPEMHVGVLIAFAKPGNDPALYAYAQNLIQLVQNELRESTGIQWHFKITETLKLENEDTRRPSDFLEKASHRMVEGPYDLMCVLTDVGLMSRANRMEVGLISSVARIMVISTRQLTVTSRKEDRPELSDELVLNNSALLFLHLTGHLLGLKHSTSRSSKIMSAENFTASRQSLPSFNAKERAILSKNVKRAPERELKGGNFIEAFIFHVLMTLRHPKDFFRPLLKNWALLLPLSLPGLATAAVAPAIILIFTAEIWDVGLGMSNTTAWVFAVISILFGSFYLVRIQSLFLPRKEKKVLTEHLAVTNSVIYFSIFLACIGLFIMVGGLIMVIELYVFPADLMQTWPTLNKPQILIGDKIRLAVFVSTVGVTTGALAGGFESRKVLQHLALFRDRI